MRRIVAAMFVLLVLVALPAAARAGEPPTLGGTLGATRDEVVIDSTATIPVLVELVAPKGWTLAETSFRMEPGTRHRVAVTTAGEDGQVIATMTAIEVTSGTDRSSLVLALGLPKPEDEPIPWVFLVFGVLPVLWIVWRARTRPMRRFRHARP